MKVKKYIEKDVLTAARERVSHLYDAFDSVVVCTSFGKDSSAILSLCHEEAERRGLKKVHAVFRDEEIICDSVINHGKEIREYPWLNLIWLTVPLRSTKFILGKTYDYIQWDSKRDWVREKPPWSISLKEGDGRVFDQYTIDEFTTQFFKGSIVFVTGIRASESLMRLRSVMNANGDGWITKIRKVKNAVMAKPIYDWEENDVFKYLNDSGFGWCFRGDTEFITKDGVKTLAECAGEEVELLTTDSEGNRKGFWRKATVKSFGVQKLWKVTLQRNKRKKVIFATKDHRWLIRPTWDRKRTAIRLTTDLKPGDGLAWNQQSPRHKNCRISHIGVAAGFIRGDGHKMAGGGCQATLWGRKDAALLPYFQLGVVSEKYSENGVHGINVAGLPSYFKDLPPLDESVGYLYGWLAGYFAADGDIGKLGTPHLTCFEKDTLTFVKVLCSRLGIGTFEILETVKELNGKKRVIYKMAFDRKDLTEGFFLCEEHRKRFLEAPSVRSRRGWTVVSVEETETEEEVFCPTVPGTACFTLADDILVMNCSHYERQLWSGMQLRVSTPLHAEQSKRLYKLRETDPEFYDRILRIFPEVQDQDRYWRDYDQQALRRQYAESFEGVRSYIEEHIEDEDQREKALTMLRNCESLHRKSPEAYPMWHILNHFMCGRYKRMPLPVIAK